MQIAHNNVDSINNNNNNNKGRKEDEDVEEDRGIQILFIRCEVRSLDISI